MRGMRAVVLASMAFGCARPAAVEAAADASTDEVTGGETSAPEARVDGRWRMVHIDTLTPETLDGFVQARLDWVAAVEQAGVEDDHWGVFVQVDETTMLGLVAFDDFAELDGLGKRRMAAANPLPEGTLERYFEGSDTALVHPHHRALWRRVDDLDYLPQNPLTLVTASGGTLVREAVQPTRTEEWFEANQALNDALAQADYPLTRRVFSESYGTGEVLSLWLSSDPAVPVPPVDDVLDDVLGEDEAAALRARIDACTAGRSTHTLRVRHDLTVDGPDR